MFDPIDGQIDHWDRATLHAKQRAVERFGMVLSPEDTKEIFREINRTRRRWRKRNGRRPYNAKSESPLRAFIAGYAREPGQSRWRVETSSFGWVVVVIDDSEQIIITIMPDSRAQFPSGGVNGR